MKFLLRSGVREPMVRWLSEIAIVEGFGAMIRELPVPPTSQLHPRGSPDGPRSAISRAGLFEAHARDEAGWSEEGGHRQMWDAARDAALSNPNISPEIYANIIACRGVPQPPAMFPELGEPVERLIRFMTNVLAIEVFAASTFAWAEEILSDPEVSDAPDDAANLVGYIRSDESPHVEYLRTALSELRACTLLGTHGEEVAGGVVVDALLARTLRVLAAERPRQQREEARADIAAAVATHRDAAGLRRRFDALEEDWSPPSALSA